MPGPLRDLAVKNTLKIMKNCVILQNLPLEELSYWLERFLETSGRPCI